MGDHPYDAVEELTFPSYSPEHERVIFASVNQSFDSLKTINLPSSIIHIGQESFRSLKSLENINISASIRQIGTKAFCNDISLPKENLPKVKVIHEKAFQGCKSLKNIDLGDSLLEIQESAFEDCVSLVSLSFPFTLEEIGYYAFQYNTSLTSLTIPGNVKNIGVSAFFRCASLKSLIIKDGVKSIGAYAFEETSIENVFLPKSVTKLGKDAITNSNGHTTIYCEADSEPEGFDITGYPEDEITYVWNTTREEFDNL